MVVSVLVWTHLLKNGGKGAIYRPIFSYAGNEQEVAEAMGLAG